MMMPAPSGGPAQVGWPDSSQHRPPAFVSPYQRGAGMVTVIPTAPPEVSATTNGPSGRPPTPEEDGSGVAVGCGVAVGWSPIHRSVNRTAER